jgi:hypothetical protein
MVEEVLGMSLPEVIDRFRSNPRPAEGSTDNPFRLESTVWGPATASEVRAAWGEHEIPDDARTLWQECRGARLFEDVDYGQWGLKLLSPQASRDRTGEDYLAEDLEADDIVIGAFIGDLDVVVLAPSEEGDRRVLVAGEIDARPKWHGVGSDLAHFLQRYFEASGDKYWKSESSGRADE